MQYRILTSLLLFLSVSLTVTAQTVNIAVEESEEAPIISRHIYGHFAEHLGRSIYGGFYVGEESDIPNEGRGCVST